MTGSKYFFGSSDISVKQKDMDYPERKEDDSVGGRTTDYSNLYTIPASAPETTYPILVGNVENHNDLPPYESNHNSIISSQSYGERRPPSQQREEGFTFHSKNKHCLLCKRILTGDDQPITLLTCSHAYHLVCGKGYLGLGKGNECPMQECQQVKKKYYYEEGGDFIPLDNGNDPETRKKLEDRFGPTGQVQEDPNRTVEAYEESYMRTNPTKDINAISRAKLLDKTIAWAGKVTYEELMEGEKTIDDMYEQKLDLLDIYFACGITEWDQLWQLDVQKEDVLTRDKVSNLGNIMVSTFGNKEKVPFFMPIRQLVDLYDVDYQQLLALDITGDDLANVLHLTPEDMDDLQITWQVLRDDFGVNNKDSFADFNFGPKMWISLGFEKSDLYGLTITHVDDILDVWPKCLERTVEAFKFTELDKKSFRIDEYLEGPPPPTRSRRRPPSSRGVISYHPSSSQGKKNPPPVKSRGGRPPPSRNTLPVIDFNRGTRKQGKMPQRNVY